MISQLRRFLSRPSPADSVAPLVSTPVPRHRQRPPGAPTIPMRIGEPHARPRADEDALADGADPSRYPPGLRGLPAVSVADILDEQADMLRSLDEALRLPLGDYERYVLPVVEAYAAYVHLLPASETHHHRGRGGLIRHGLEVAYHAARAATGAVFTLESSRYRREPVWRAATAIAGLLHDIGKPAADIIVSDREDTWRWVPAREPLAHALSAAGLRHYYVTWRPDRNGRHERHGPLMLHHCMPEQTADWLTDTDPKIYEHVLAATGGADKDGVVGRLVMQGEAISVRQDLRASGYDPDAYTLGVPVDRYLIDAMRELVRRGTWTCNTAGARLWHFDAGLHLVWEAGVAQNPEKDRAAAREIVELLDEQGIPAFPRTPEEISRVLIEHGHFQTWDEGGHARFLHAITSECFSNTGKSSTLLMARLSSPALIYRHEPPPSMPMPGAPRSGGQTERRDARQGGPLGQGSPAQGGAGQVRQQSSATAAVLAQRQSSTPVHPSSPPDTTRSSLPEHVDPDTGEILSSGDAAEPDVGDVIDDLVSGVDDIAEISAERRDADREEASARSHPDATAGAGGTGRVEGAATPRTPSDGTLTRDAIRPAAAQSRPMVQAPKPPASKHQRPETTRAQSAPSSTPTASAASPSPTNAGATSTRDDPREAARAWLRQRGRAGEILLALIDRRSLADCPAEAKPFAHDGHVCWPWKAGLSVLSDADPMQALGALYDAGLTWIDRRSAQGRTRELDGRRVVMLTEVASDRVLVLTGPLPPEHPGSAADSAAAAGEPSASGSVSKPKPKPKPKPAPAFASPPSDCSLAGSTDTSQRAKTPEGVAPLDISAEGLYRALVQGLRDGTLDLPDLPDDWMQAERVVVPRDVVATLAEQAELKAPTYVRRVSLNDAVLAQDGGLVLIPRMIRSQS